MSEHDTPKLIGSPQESSPYRFITEASEQGWPPGHWPQRVSTVLGNKRDLVLRSVNSEAAEYQQEWGIIRLTVLND